MSKTYYTLDKWFSKETKLTYGTKVFYADLLNNDIKWLNKVPKDGLTIGSFKWNSEYVNLCLTRESLSLLKKKIKINKTNSYSNISILKSNLQKCVRRLYVKNAVNTAFQMCLINKGLNQLLRRLIIIAVEDACATYDIIKLCYLMCISSKINLVGENTLSSIELSEYVLKFCLKFTKFITKIKIRDPEYCVGKKTSVESIVNSCLSDKNKSFIMCLFTRAEYGGMECDIDMLIKSGSVWLKRLASEKIMWHNLITLTCENEKVDLVNKFKKSSIIRYSYDFHCTNIMKKMKEQFPNYLEEELKKAIWYYSSGVNKKNKIVLIHDYNKKLYRQVWLTIGGTYFTLIKK